MARPERNVTFTGPPNSGKKTLIGNLFYMTALDLDVMGKLQKRGVSKYDEVVAALGDMKVSPAFETPKYHVKVVKSSKEPHCTILVLPVESDIDKFEFKEWLAPGQPFICVVNKMNNIDWEASRFREFAMKVKKHLAAAADSSILVVPAEALKGDNLLEPSKKGSIIEIGPGDDVSEAPAATLIECLDHVLSSSK